ncbi:uncharacterized protein [Aristolochia californica]|uniref:uncharacterized protein n=1 Tax=Aristolochia californica TaxID=171875 RepID=UPI0035D98464
MDKHVETPMDLQHCYRLDKEFTTNLKKAYYVQVVYQLLQLHTLDKIKKFRPCFCPGDRYSSDLTKWIKFVKVEGFGELVLDLSGSVRHSDSTDDDDIRWGMNKFSMSNSLLSCLSISSLNLTCCILEPPEDVKGFKTLSGVAFYRMTITGDQVEIQKIGLFVLLSIDIFTQLNLMHQGASLQFQRDGDKQAEPEESRGQGSSCDMPTFKDIPSLNESIEMLTIRLDFYFELSRDVDHLNLSLSN